MSTVPAVWQAIGVIIAIGAGTLATVGWFSSIADTKIADHDKRPIAPVEGLPVHPQYAAAIKEQNEKIAALKRRIEELEVIVEEDLRWRTGYIAADAEPIAKRRPTAASNARETYDELVKRWPCPDDVGGCTTPSQAVRIAIKEEIPDR